MSKHKVPLEEKQRRMRERQSTRSATPTFPPELEPETEDLGRKPPQRERRAPVDWNDPDQCVSPQDLAPRMRVGVDQAREAMELHPAFRDYSRSALNPAYRKEVDRRGIKTRRLPRLPVWAARQLLELPPSQWTATKPDEDQAKG